MTRRWVAGLLALFCLVGMGGYSMDDNRILEMLKRPDQMNGQEYAAFISQQFERSGSGKLVTVPPLVARFPLNPGTYYITNPLTAFIYNDGNGVAWNLGTNGAFSCKGILEIQSGNALPIRLLYYPIQSDYGVPLETTVTEAGGQLSLFVPFGGSGSAIEITALSAFTRNLTLNGPMQIQYVAAAGSQLLVAYNANL